MITYIKGNLFDAPSDRLLVHACNTQGVWGSGIAKQFKTNFPSEFILYNKYCDSFFPDIFIFSGEALILNKVVCLFTSEDYGPNVDPSHLILHNTELAMKDLLSKTTMKLAMPKINSGLFNVPWEDTEKILNKFDVDIWVYEL